jgi:protein-S-isoprenylcysteine O-methyltransferase Ste14
LRQRVRVGLPVVVVCAWLARPTPGSLVAGALVAVVGLGVRALAASHLTKHTGLVTTGPYALTRNPLYLGSAIVAAGLLLAARSPVAAALAAAYFATFYPSVIGHEEGRLRARHGDAFADYAARVPRLLPRVPRGRLRFAASWRVYLRNREYQSAIGVAVAMAFLYLRMRQAP